MRLRLPFLALLAAAWSVGAPPASAQNVAELDVTPRNVTLGVGQVREVLASAFDARGNILSVSFRWISRAPNVVRVEEDPTVPGVANLIGLSPGVAAVDVRVGSRERTVTVEVIGGAMGGPVGTGTATVLQIEPTAVLLFPAEDLQLRPIFLKDDGSPASPTALTWRSFREDVATVDRAGRVLGISPGQGLIEATTSTGLQRRVTVQVAITEWAFSIPVLSLSPAQSDTIWVMVPAQSNRRVTPRGLTWSSTNLNVATVTPLGVATAISPGQAEIVVNGFGQEKRLPVSVHREVEFLAVLAPPGDTLVIPLGGSVFIKATAEAADQTPVPEAQIYWIVGDTSIATYVPRDTAAIGKKIGRTTITVRAPGNLEKVWPVQVVSAGLVLDIHRLGLRLGERATLKASYSDEAGTPLAPATSVGWTSSDPTVVRVDANGNLMPGAFGSANVTATTPWGNADTARVFVQGDVLVTSTRGGSADIYAFDRNFPAQLSPIAQHPAWDVSAAYAPDGTRIVFVTDRDGNFEIYSADADGSNTARVTRSGANEGNPTWTRDGQQIVYQSNEGGGGTTQLWIMDADGSNQRQLTSGTASNIQPAVSPDGATIAFTSTRDGRHQIYLMNLDGSNQRNFTGSVDNETLPAWVGDTAIAFLHVEGTGRRASHTVVRMNFSRETTALTQPQLSIRDFAISNDGELLAAAAVAPTPAGGEAQRLFLIPLGVGTPVEVPREGEQDELVHPSFRP